VRSDVTPISAKRSWLFAPRTLQTSPFTMLAAAGLVIALTVGATRVLTSRSPELATAPALMNPKAPISGAATVDGAVVRFTLQAPKAKAVALVGDFNGWNPAITNLELRDGVWSVVIPVSPGRHQYGFVVDGTRWSADPTAPQAAEGDFGSENSVVYVGS
jgi:hypothetical protein